jgi:hypothetical protein
VGAEGGLGLVPPDPVMPSSKTSKTSIEPEDAISK